MAISVTFNDSANHDFRVVSGQYTLAKGDTLGNITTGLMHILAAGVTSSGQLYTASVNNPNIRLNHDGSAASQGTLRIENALDGDDGDWWAIGYGG